MVAMLNWLSGLSVHEDQITIECRGIHGRDLAKFMTRVWKTSTLDTYMFINRTSTYFRFYRFFAVDVLYILERLAKERNPRVPSRTLKQLADLVKEKTWLKDINDDVPGRLDFSKLNLFTYTPTDFQQGFFEYYDKVPTRYRLNGALLNAAPGAGKTFTTTAVMTMAGMEKIIVVCPKNALHRVWEDDVNKFFKQPPSVWTSDNPLPPKESDVIRVYHYEALDRALMDNKTIFGKYKIGMILDESHNLNDPTSQRTKRWMELCRLSGSTNIIHASGTPFKAMGSESIPLLRVIDPMFTPKVENNYKKIFGHSAQRGLDILQNRLGVVSYVVRKEQLNLEKPEIVFEGVKTPDSKAYELDSVKEAMREFIKERVIYYKKREMQDLNFYRHCLSIHEEKIKHDSRQMDAFLIYKDYISQIQRSNDITKLTEETKYCKEYEYYTISASLPKESVKDFRSVCSVIKYLTLKIQGECLGQVVGRLRIDAHVSMSRHIPFRDICQSTTKKTVVFTSYVDVLETAGQTCKTQDLTPVLVYGKTNKDLAGTVKAFEVDERLNPLIATYDSLSTAVPLIMADTMITINSPFRSYILDQAISRIHRLGQTSKTKVYQYYLDTGDKPNISSRSMDIMRWSQEQVEAMTGVRSPYAISEDGNVMNIGVESASDLDVQVSYHPKYQSVDVKLYSQRPSRSGW